MRIILLNLNPLDFTHLDVNPYGLEIIAADLKKHFPKAHVKLTNPFYYSRPRAYLKELIETLNPQIIGASIRNIDNALVYADYGNRQKLDTHLYVDRAKSILDYVALHTNAPIILGGSGFSVAPDTFLKYFDLTLGVIGPGEETFTKLCLLLKSEGCLSLDTLLNEAKSYPGLTIKKRSGGVMVNPISDKISGTFRILRSEEHKHHFNRDFFLPVRYSVGCPLRCSYCIEHVNMSKVNHRDTDEIIDEIKFINKKYECRNIWLTASEINLPSHPLKALCKKIIKNKLNLKNRFRAYFFGKPFSKDLCLLLIEAGFDLIPFTMSHFNHQLLRRNGQMIRKEEFFEALQIIKDCGGPLYNLGLLLGMPGETGETLGELFDSLKFIETEFTEDLSVYYSVGVRVYPNTPLANFCRSKGFCHPHIVGKDRQFIEPVYYCAPFPPSQLYRYVKLHLDKLKLQGRYQLMNGEIVKDYGKGKGFISLQKSLRLLSIGRNKEALRTYKKAIGILAEDKLFRKKYMHLEKKFGSLDS